MLYPPGTQQQSRAPADGSNVVPTHVRDVVSYPNPMAISESETITGLHPIELLRLSSEPLVSILISNYNYGRYIGESIQSALDQTYSNIELIICDDGSTDDSVSIIEEYQRKDPRLKLICKANGGQASGFNAAFAASRGEIIALLDSDDRFPAEQSRADCG